MDKLYALQNFILSEILNAPTEDNLLLWTGKTFIQNGKEATPAEARSLIASAEALMKNAFWQSLIFEMKREGQNRIGSTSRSWEDVQFGKACLYMADLAEKKTKTVASLKI